MSEERKMILEMLAEGKITTAEADTLLQAIEESERTAQETVVEGAQKSERTADTLTSFGRLIDSAVSEARRALDETFRSLEGRVDDKIQQQQLRRRVETRIRRSTEKALEKALQAEERAARAAQDLGGETGRVPKKTIVKMGIHIDKQSVERIETVEIAAQPGDRLMLENRVGDVQVEFYEGDQIEVEVRKTVWGTDEADANRRAEATQVLLVRNGAEVKVVIDRPSYAVVGVLDMKDTRMDFTIRVPRQTHLQVTTKVGNIRVEGDEAITTWDLAAKVGDIDITVPEDAGFGYRLRTSVGMVDIDLLEDRASVTQSETRRAKGEPVIVGTYGDGRGSIEARIATGDIRLHH